MSISKAKRAHNQKYYEAHKDYFESKRTEYIRRKRHRLDELKASTPCADCGRTDFPHLMDFHHEREKKDTISRMLRNNVAWKKVEAELEKCVLLCCRCHRIRHTPVDPADSAPS